MLQKLQTPVINNAECAIDLSEYDNAAIFDTHICSQSINLDSGACEVLSRLDLYEVYFSTKENSLVGYVQIIWFLGIGLLTLGLP